jgi:hypothetical protein
MGNGQLSKNHIMKADGFAHRNTRTRIRQSRFCCSNSPQPKKQFRRESGPEQYRLLARLEMGSPLNLVLQG